MYDYKLTMLDYVILKGAKTVNYEVKVLNCSLDLAEERIRDLLNAGWYIMKMNILPDRNGNPKVVGIFQILETE